MTRICSKRGPRYPTYNDKKNRCMPWWSFGLRNFSSAILEPPEPIYPIIPRPIHNPNHIIKQPTATMGFVRGNRNLIKDNNNEKS